MTRLRVAVLSLLVALSTSPLAAQRAWSGLPAAQQIRLALQAAPAELRDGATVQGYDETGAFVTLRKGTAPLICMAPNPKSERLEVSCHQAGLEAFFARGRDLRAQGVADDKVIHTRWEENAAGKLPIPYGSVNNIVTGSGFDPETGAIEGRYERWTIYRPVLSGVAPGV